jgi:hypothetical protein
MFDDLEFRFGPVGCVGAVFLIVVIIALIAGLLYIPWSLVLHE